MKFFLRIAIRSISRQRDESVERTGAVQITKQCDVLCELTFHYIALKQKEKTRRICSVCLRFRTVNRITMARELAAIIRNTLFWQLTTRTNNLKTTTTTIASKKVKISNYEL